MARELQPETAMWEAETLVRALVGELEEDNEECGTYCIACGLPHSEECPAGKAREWLARRGKPMPDFYKVTCEHCDGKGCTNCDGRGWG